MRQLRLIPILAGLLLCGPVLAVSPPVPGPAKKAADPRIDAGAKRFNQNCVYCHGNAGSGGKAAPLQGREDLTHDYVIDVIANGKQRGAFLMPAWKNSFSEEQIGELAAYILSLKQPSLSLIHI